ncbi:unnamed protein product, partial [Mesocestoides corti]|uniref:Mediator of RNA polymerase II transcription subunit 13 n=1 Tax=Mesocestoides corti TaxID=53468 RepID=A0A0R3UBD4_MESCO
HGDTLGWGGGGGRSRRGGGKQCVQADKDLLYDRCLADQRQGESFTSLYSLHTFEWRKPNLPLTLVCETPVIKEIFVGLDTLLPTTAPRPPSSSSPSEGVPVVPLIRAALNQFEVLNQTRRDGPGDCVRRRHLILVMLSPCLGVASLEAEAAALAGEAVVEEAELAVEDGAVAAAVAAADEAEGPAARKSRKGVLAQLRELRVAVSAFTPCEHKNLMRLVSVAPS